MEELRNDELEMIFEVICGNVEMEVTSEDSWMISGNDEIEAINTVISGATFVQEQVEDLLDNLHQSHNSISSSPSPIVSSQSTPGNKISNGNTEESDVQRAATKRKNRLLL